MATRVPDEEPAGMDKRSQSAEDRIECLRQKSDWVMVKRKRSGESRERRAVEDDEERECRRLIAEAGGQPERSSQQLVNCGV
jgi:hypothetical protein